MIALQAQKTPHVIPAVSPFVATDEAARIVEAFVEFSALIADISPLMHPEPTPNNEPDWLTRAYALASKERTRICSSI